MTSFLYSRAEQRDRVVKSIREFKKLLYIWKDKIVGIVDCDTMWCDNVVGISFLAKNPIYSDVVFMYRIYYRVKFYNNKEMVLKRISKYIDEFSKNICTESWYIGLLKSDNHPTKPNSSIIFHQPLLNIEYIQNIQKHHVLSDFYAIIIKSALNTDTTKSIVLDISVDEYDDIMKYLVSLGRYDLIMLWGNN
jgi:hypothetical protein